MVILEDNPYATTCLGSVRLNGRGDVVSKFSRKVSRINREWQPEPALLLCPQVPKPLHGLAPRVVLGSKWWNDTRKEAYRSTSYHCLACGVSKYDAQYRKWLEGHEIYEVDYLVGRSEYIRTVPLCNYCHSFIHAGRLQAQLDKGTINHARYAAIIRHGNGVLQQAGLRRVEYEGPFAEWGDWRLIVNGKEYAPLFKTEAEWIKVYG